MKFTAAAREIIEIGTDDVANKLTTESEDIKGKKNQKKVGPSNSFLARRKKYTFLGLKFPDSRSYIE